MTQTPRAAATKVWMLILGIAVAAAILWSVVAGLPANMEVTQISWIVLAVAFAVVERLDARLEIGGETHTVNAADALLVIGLASLAPLPLLAARAVGDLAGTIVWHRSGLQKAAFNLTNRVLECGIAYAAYSLVIREASPVSGWGWLAAFIGIFAASPVSYLTITAAISLNSGKYNGSMKEFSLQAAIMACNVVMGLVAVNVLWVDERGAWMIVVGFVIASIGYRAYLKTRERLASLTSLERFASQLSGETESAIVIERALHNVAELLRAGEVRLVRNIPDGIKVQRLAPKARSGVNAADDLTSATGTSTNVITEIFHTDEIPAPFAILMARNHGLLITADDRLSPHRVLLDHLGWSDLVSAPLSIDGESSGVLVAGNRLAEHSTFDDNDQHLLETFAANTSVALRVGELVDQLRAQALEKEHQSRHDALTKLPNRMVADERLRQLLPLATGELMVAVMFMDLDRFKEVNDALGHHVGDELLREVANRLRQVVGRRGTVARLGGDEFAVIVPGVTDVDELTAMATNLRSEIAKQVVIDRLSLNPLASVGIALAPHDGTDARSLFQRADVAMYAAKNRRTGFEYYDPRFDKASTRTLSLTADLRTALATDQLQLHYQPQATLDGRIVAIEALARWPHPRYGSVPPEEFITVAEQHGLIHILTRWAVSTALTDLRFLRETYPDLRVSVNMSARDLMDLTFPSDVEELLRSVDLPPDVLTLELTESQMLSDRRRSIEMLGRLRALGVRIAVDDFGTGQSSLAYLKSLPIHEVKIDRSFVFSMATSHDDAVIVRSIIDMAHNLGLEAVAEGVEDIEVWRMLGDRGCDSAQGYFITPGLPVRELARWLAARHIADQQSDDDGRPIASVIRLVPRAS